MHQSNERIVKHKIGLLELVDVKKFSAGFSRKKIRRLSIQHLWSI
jgi:hypothetical protein